MRLNRRCFLRTTTAAAAACIAGQGLLAAEEQPASDASYRRANTDWLAKCRFGIGVHWTAQTVPRRGPPKSMQKAVADFDLTSFMAAVEHAGADYVLFTAAHALQMLPAPNPVLDKILPGRICERDLIRELADDEAAYRSITLSWFDHSPLHDIIRFIAEKGARLILTTDHGSVKCQNPVKILGDRNTNTNLRYKFGKNLNYNPQDVFEVKHPEEIFLPRINVSTSYVFCRENDYFVYPNNYSHFANFYRNTFQHGGISMEEVLIPVIDLKAR